jgi:S1-C subfamily serine protease
LSDAWFYGSRKNDGNRGNALWVIIIIFMIINVGVLSYVTFFIDTDSPTTKEFNEIKTRLENLQFQLSSAQMEIELLQDQIKIGKISNNNSSLILTQLYNQTRRSVVLISVTTPTGGGTGSGFIYDMEGRIITNNHVVENADSIEVTFIDGTIVEAGLVGTDPYSDMAVIQIDVPNDLLRPLILGDSSDLLVGETAVAIGNPFGLANTMTAGIISALGRQSSVQGNYVVVDVIQTDAAINPGNSGGPLLNTEGEVIGMNTWILSQTGQFSGIGFAIPSNTIKREIDSLIDTGTYEHPWIGIQGRDLTPAIAREMGLDSSIRGTLVVDVVERGPAENAGLLGSDRNVIIDSQQVAIGGDVIIGADGKTMKTFYDLIFYVSREKQPGDNLSLMIIRDGNTMEIDLTLGVRPPPT